MATVRKSPTVVKIQVEDDDVIEDIDRRRQQKKMKKKKEKERMKMRGFESSVSSSLLARNRLLFIFITFIVAVATVSFVFKNLNPVYSSPSRSTTTMPAPARIRPLLIRPTSTTTAATSTTTAVTSTTTAATATINTAATNNTVGSSPSETPTASPPSKSPAASPASLPKFYILALTWPPSYLAKEDPNRILPNAVRRRPYFSVHGIWEQRYFAGTWYPVRCNPLLGLPYNQQQVPDGLAQYWINVRDRKDNHHFWRREWSKHGKCMGISQLDYFRKAKRLMRIETNGNSIFSIGSLLTDRIGQKMPIYEFETIIKGIHGVKTDINCYFNGTHYLLSELHFFLKPTFDEFSDCPVVRRAKCHGADITLTAPDPPPPSPPSPHRFSVAGEEDEAYS